MSENIDRKRAPEEALELASAIARRSGKTSELASRIVSALSGEKYIPKTPEQLIQENIGRTALYLAKVESPESTITWEERTDATGYSGGYAKIANKINAALENDGVSVSTDEARRLNQALIKDLSEASGITDEDLTKDFAVTLAMAREIANEQGISTATVYENDELYFETIRRAFTPSETAAQMLKTIDAVSTDTMKKLITQVIDTLIGNTVDDLGNELEVLSEELRQDPELQSACTKISETLQEAMRQAGTYMMIRTYGADVMNNLAVDQQIALEPRQPLVKEVLDTLK